jgi:uncharacterized protein (TIGR00251 family)
VTKRVILWIQVHPRAGKTEVVGWHGDAIKIRLRAPPVDGAANEELIRFLSKTFHVPRSAIHILSGATAQRKRIKVESIDRTDLKAALGI